MESLLLMSPSFLKNVKSQIYEYSKLLKKLHLTNTQENDLWELENDRPSDNSGLYRAVLYFWKIKLTLSDIE
jgi:hypothetical protein